MSWGRVGDLSWVRPTPTPLATGGRRADRAEGDMCSRIVQEPVARLWRGSAIVSRGPHQGGPANPRHRLFRLPFEDPRGKAGGAAGTPSRSPSPPHQWWASTRMTADELAVARAGQVGSMEARELYAGMSARFGVTGPECHLESRISFSWATTIDVPAAAERGDGPESLRGEEIDAGGVPHQQRSKMLSFSFGRLSISPSDNQSEVAEGGEEEEESLRAIIVRQTSGPH